MRLVAVPVFPEINVPAVQLLDKVCDTPDSIGAPTSLAISRGLVSSHFKLVRVPTEEFTFVVDLFFGRNALPPTILGPLPFSSGRFFPDPSSLSLP